MYSLTENVKCNIVISYYIKVQTRKPLIFFTFNMYK